MSYQERALAIIDRLTDSKAINIRERGTLRRAILLPERPQGDLISREALIKAIKTEFDYASATGFSRKMANIKSIDLICMIFRLINNTPTVELDEMTQDLIDKVNVNVGLAQPIKDERLQGDLISREALKKAYFNAINETSIGEVSIIDIIDNAPTVSEITKEKLAIAYEQGYEDGKNNWLQEERPQGEWIEGYHDYFETLDCSLCGYVRNERHLTLNFCPNCGAKMKGGAE